MGKIEKTLELNITHEILSLADGFWWFLQPTSLKRYWRPHWRFPFMETPKSFASGLHINLEGKKGGGYDVCINSPSNFQGGNPRLLFMQFKAGLEMPFNKNSESIFYGDAANPNIHIEFDINHNDKRNQHRLLKELAINAGNENAVVYVFPRIVNENQLQDNIGKLLIKTSFISIEDIDSKAASNKIIIDDGNPHKFRTCYNDYNKNEINLLLLVLGKINMPGKYLGEIFAIRLYRALQSLQKVQVEDFTISNYHIIDAMIRHVFNLGLFFSIPLQFIETHFSSIRSFNRRLDYLYKFEDLPKVYRVEINAGESVIEIFGDILNSLSQYFKWIDQIEAFQNMQIPPPPSDYTIELGGNGIRFSIGNQDKKKDLTLEDFDNITYSLF